MPPTVQNVTRQTQVCIKDKAYDLVMKIKDQGELPSATEAVKKSLSVYDWLLEKRNQGYELWLVKEGETPKSIELL